MFACFIKSSSTPYIEQWTNIYVSFLIEAIVQAIVCYVYYLVHMTSAFFHIGFAYYVEAMRTDLKLRMQEIHFIMLNLKDTADPEFDISIEIKFHGQLFE